MLGPASGIAASPGLPWATCNVAVGDLDGTRASLDRQGCRPCPIDGSVDVCRFFTVLDPDGNTLLITDR